MTEQTFIGSDIERELSIPQQYRSRFEKQFSNFISSNSDFPRMYTEQDMLVFRVIVDYKNQNKRIDRRAIIAQLASLVKAGQLTFYPSELVTDINQILEPAVSQPAADKPKSVKRQPRQRQERQPGLAEKVAALNERVVMLQEENSELAVIVERQNDQIAALLNTVYALSAKVQEIELMVNRPVKLRIF
jgi:hypothetical protein